jgi:hypothetical protein
MSHGAVSALLDQKTHKTHNRPGPGPPAPPRRRPVAQHAARSSRAEPGARPPAATATP